jgi:hypothetical protein
MCVSMTCHFAIVWFCSSCKNGFIRSQKHVCVNDMSHAQFPQYTLGFFNGFHEGYLFCHIPLLWSCFSHAQEPIHTLYRHYFKARWGVNSTHFFSAYFQKYHLFLCPGVLLSKQSGHHVIYKLRILQQHSPEHGFLNVNPSLHLIFCAFALHCINDGVIKQGSQTGAFLFSITSLLPFS